MVRDKGEAWVHWQLEVQDPKQPKSLAGQVEFQVHARLFADGHLVFERDDSPKFAVPAAAEEGLKKRPFQYEDRLAVAPGKYRLMVTARNVAANQTYEATRDFEVAMPDERLAMSEVVVVSRYEPDRRERPFQFGGIKFFPDPEGAATLGQGLRVCYQVSLSGPRPAELPVEYVIGNVATRDKKTFEDKLDLRALDASGVLVTGKTLSLEGLAPGSYQLAVRAKDPRTGRVAARAVAFTIAEDPGEVQPIVISQGQADTPQRLAANQYERALCWLAQGRSQEALAALEASWKIHQNPAVQGLLEHLHARSGQLARQ